MTLALVKHPQCPQCIAQDFAQCVMPVTPLEQYIKALESAIAGYDQAIANCDDVWLEPYIAAGGANMVRLRSPHPRPEWGNQLFRGIGPEGSPEHCYWDVRLGTLGRAKIYRALYQARLEVAIAAKQNPIPLAQEVFGYA